jgi:hypothetical protein
MEVCESAVRFCTKTPHQSTKRFVCFCVWLKNAVNATLGSINSREFLN